MHLRLSHARTFALVLAAAGAVFACSSAKQRTSFISEVDPNQASKDGGTTGDAGDDIADFGDGGPACEGLACQQVACDEEGVTTTLTGKVYDPAGKVPLYNVMVYVPSGDPKADLPPLADGVQCATCASVVVNPLVSALTDTSGAFKLENVPVGDGVPLVMQIGKWRRKIEVDVKTSCAENKVPKADSHLPRNGSEGDMPHIAVTTGALDSLECLFVGMGVDDTEFVAGSDMSGHIHMYEGNMTNGAGWPDAWTDLWSNLDELKKYDISLFSCEGSEYLDKKGGDDASARQPIVDYLNMGGRVFATHFHRVWFKESPDESLKGVADWVPASNTSDKVATINTSFPKGQALADWLKAIGASSTKGELPLSDKTSSITTVSSDAQSWIEDSNGVPKYFSFNTPVGAAEDKQCGRGVFSDLHMFSGHKDLNECGGSLNAQQKALEFMFFDLAGCVQDDKKPPSIPK